MKKLILTFLCCIMMLITPAAAFANETAIADSFPMKKNDSGIYTAVIQQRLYDLGYIHFRPTGKYADLTVLAVRNFQARNKLSVTGELTYDT